jgi:hypothetical protein
VSPLKVSDLKPGDVVRIDLVVSAARSVGVVRLGFEQVSLEDDRWIRATDHWLAAGNAELVVRPRPVRKGDEVRHDNGSVRVFVANWRDGFLYGSTDRPEEGHCLWSQFDSWSHADGSPIDWEASE